MGLELFGVTPLFYLSYLILSGWNTLIGHFPGHYCVLCFNGLEGKWLSEGLDTTPDAKRASQTFSALHVLWRRADASLLATEAMMTLGDRKSVMGVHTICDEKSELEVRLTGALDRCASGAYARIPTHSQSARMCGATGGDEVPI
jgi:hypothetical protein